MQMQESESNGSLLRNSKLLLHFPNIYMLQNANASLSPTVHYFADPSMFLEKTSHLHLLVVSVGENPYPYHLVAHILKI